MVKPDKMIKVTNRGYGDVGYTIPDLNQRRLFASGESKQIPFVELEKLNYLRGGKRLIEKYLVIHDEDAVEQLLGEVEPEYFYEAEDVKEILENGSLDQLDDCLTFGGAGIVDMVRKIAIDTELNDVKKRKLILEKTGFNISKAIEINQLSENAEEAKEAPKRRKASPVKKAEEVDDGQPKRKTTAIKKTTK